ncbi:MAG TPA: homoserine kinase [Bacilli bacterium]
MKQGSVTVKVPASTANLGPGFDSLGMALNLFAWIEMDIAEKTKIELLDANTQGVPLDKTNLIYESACNVYAAVGEPPPELNITIKSDIPLTRGLGSSAAAIVGGMVAANALLGEPLARRDLLQLATRLENHPDNVGASLFGGIVVSSWDGDRAECVRIEPDPRLAVIAVIPEFTLATEQARGLLPKQVAMQDAVHNLSHSSLLVAALATGNLSLLEFAMRDRLHQPYRAPLIPGMEAILRNATDHGALAAALSGAGPTILTLIDQTSGNRTRLERFLADTYAGLGMPYKTIFLHPSAEGATLLTDGGESCKLSANKKGEIRQC